MGDFDCFCQFTGHTVDFAIQWLILWPHSKWQNECYYDNYIFWKESMEMEDIFISCDPEDQQRC